MMSAKGSIVQRRACKTGLPAAMRRPESQPPPRDPRSAVRYGIQAIMPRTENLYASIYSALGIDWKKELTNTPSKRAYRYVDILGATELVADDEIADLFV